MYVYIYRNTTPTDLSDLQDLVGGICFFCILTLGSEVPPLPLPENECPGTVDLESPKMVCKELAPGRLPQALCSYIYEPIHAHMKVYFYS